MRAIKPARREDRRNFAVATGVDSQTGCTMAAQVRQLYTSPNGDIWSLSRSDGGRLAVLHEPNAPSGGAPSQIELSAFLKEDNRGPEHQALRQLIGELVQPTLPAEYDDHD
jgi:hypothetical protein